jgi:hypothetical protein
MSLKRAVAESGSPQSLLPDGSGGVWEKQFPNVVEFLSSLRWEDGTARSTGTVMLMVEGGLWKAWVHDRDAGRGAFASAATLAKLLAVVNDGLETGSMDWRPDKRAAKK